MAAHTVYLSLLWLLAAGFDGNDRPVTSGAPHGTGAGIPHGIIGRVAATDGRPIPNAWVRTSSLDRPSAPIPEIAILTDAGGRYMWPLPPGTYQVSVSAAGYRDATMRVMVGVGEPV